MKKLISTKNLSREEWLKTRKKGIGGSDIAGVCGLSTYKSPLSIYLDKKDLMPETEEENIAMELGLELEPFLSKKFVKWIKKNEGLDIELKEMPSILQDDKVDYFLVNLDRWFEHPQKGKCVVELKTATEFKRDQWKDEQIPDEYFLQVQWQLMITGWEYCYLAFLIGNRKFDVKVIERNEKIIKSLKEKGMEFWEKFILKETPPAPIGLKTDAEALKVLYPEEVMGKEQVLTIDEEEEILNILDKMEKQNNIKKEAEKELEISKQLIKSTIGENEYMKAGDRTITYKTIELKERFVKAYSYRRLYISKKRIN